MRGVNEIRLRSSGNALDDNVDGGDDGLIQFFSSARRAETGRLIRRRNLADASCSPTTELPTDSPNSSRDSSLSMSNSLEHLSMETTEEEKKKRRGKGDAGKEDKCPFLFA